MGISVPVVAEISSPQPAWRKLNSTTRDSGVSTSTSYESKFQLLHTAETPKLVHRLSTLCRADVQHPLATVHSVYFDTSDWRLLEDKLAGNYIKLKVRLRWYSDPQTGRVDQACFLETKRRVGAQREKRRLRFPMPGARLQQDWRGLEVGRMVRELLPSLGMKTPSGLLPTFEIQYHRRRFVDTTTAARLSIDSRILAPVLYPARGAHRLVQPLDRTILELKGPAPRLPNQLKRLGDVGLRQTSFSKYASCALEILK